MLAHASPPGWGTGGRWRRSYYWRMRVWLHAASHTHNGSTGRRATPCVGRILGLAWVDLSVHSEGCTCFVGTDLLLVCIAVPFDF